MKITRTATARVLNAPNGTVVDFWLNEAAPESQADKKSLARIRAAAAKACDGLVVSDDSPFLKLPNLFQAPPERR